MLKVGLTGGLASGKSFVGRTLADLGCFLIQADALGHQVIEPGGEAYDRVVSLFGREILNSEERIDRKRLASLVFSDPEKLAQLNALVHPPVKARERALAAGFAGEHPDGIAVTEAVCRPEQQVARAMERDGASREEVLDRLRRQMPLEDKVKYADFVIDTSGSKENTLQQVRTVYEALRRLNP
jgi:dephospho-CoA kinase